MTFSTEVGGLGRGWSPVPMLSQPITLLRALARMSSKASMFLIRCSSSSSRPGSIPRSVKGALALDRTALVVEPLSRDGAGGARAPSIHARWFVLRPHRTPPHAPHPLLSFISRQLPPYSTLVLDWGARSAAQFSEPRPAVATRAFDDKTHRCTTSPRLRRVEGRVEGSHPPPFPIQPPVPIQPFPIQRVGSTACHPWGVDHARGGRCIRPPLAAGRRMRRPPCARSTPPPPPGTRAMARRQRGGRGPSPLHVGREAG